MSELLHLLQFSPLLDSLPRGTGCSYHGFPSSHFDHIQFFVAVARLTRRSDWDSSQLSFDSCCLCAPALSFVHLFRLGGLCDVQKGDVLSRCQSQRGVEPLVLCRRADGVARRSWLLRLGRLPTWSRCIWHVLPKVATSRLSRPTRAFRARLADFRVGPGFFACTTALGEHSCRTPLCKSRDSPLWEGNNSCEVSSHGRRHLVCGTGGPEGDWIAPSPAPCADWPRDLSRGQTEYLRARS